MPSPLDQMMQQSQGQGGGSPLDRMMQSQSSPLDQMMRKRTSGPVGMASYGTGQQGWKTAYEGVQRAWTPMRTAIGYLQVPQSAVMQSFERPPQAGEEYGQFAVPNPLTPVGRQQIGRAWSNAWQSARAGEMPPDYMARMFQAGQPWYLSLPLGLVADLATDPLTYMGIGPLKKMAQGLRMFSESKIPQIVRTTMQTHNLTQVGPDVANVAKWAAGHAYETVRAGQHPARVAELAPGRAMEAMRGVGTIAHRMDPTTIRSFERFAVDLGSQVNPSGQIDALSPAAQAALRDMVSPAAQDAARTGESWIKLRSPFVPKAEVPIVRNPVGPAIRAALASPRLESVVGPASRLLSTSARGPGGTMAAEAVREAGTGARQMMTEGVERIKAFGESVPPISRAFIRRADEVRVQPVGSFAKDFGIYQQAPDILQQRMPGAALTMPHVSQAATEAVQAITAGVDPLTAPTLGNLSDYSRAWLADNLSSVKALPPQDVQLAIAQGITQAEKDAIADRFLKLSVIAEMSDRATAKAGITPATKARLLNLEMPPNMTVAQYDALLERVAKGPKVLWRDPGDLHVRYIPKIDLARKYEQFSRGFLEEQITKPELAGGVLKPEQVIEGYQPGVMPNQPALLRDSLRAIIQRDVGPVDEAALEQAAKAIEAAPKQAMREFRMSQKPALEAAIADIRAQRARPPAQTVPVGGRVSAPEAPIQSAEEVAHYTSVAEARGRVRQAEEALGAARRPGAAAPATFEAFAKNAIDELTRAARDYAMPQTMAQSDRAIAVMDKYGLRFPEGTGNRGIAEQLFHRASLIQDFLDGKSPTNFAVKDLKKVFGTTSVPEQAAVKGPNVAQLESNLQKARQDLNQLEARKPPPARPPVAPPSQPMAAQPGPSVRPLTPGQERREIAKVAAQFKAERPPAATRDWQLYLATHIDPARLPTVQSYLDRFTSRAGVNTIPGWIEFTDRSNPMKSILGIGPSVRGFEKYKSLETPTKAALAGYQADMDMQGMLYGRYRASVYARSRKRLEDFMLGVGLPPDHPQAAGRVSLVELGKTKGLSPQQVAASFPELTQGDLRFLPDVAHLILGTREASFREPAIGWLSQLYYKGLSTWKGGATIANNAWAMNNIQGMTVNNFIRGVRDPRMYLLGAAVAAEHPEWQRVLGEVARAAMPERIYKQGDTFFVRMPMGDMDFASLHQAGVQYGWHSGWHTAALENAPRAAFLSKPPPAWLGPIPKLMTPVVLRRLNRLNPLSPGFAAYAGTVWLGEGAEELYRHVLGLHQLFNGDGWAEASRIVRDTHFDYGELTPIERQVKSALFPFFTWARRNPEFQIGMLLHEPGTVAIVPRLVNAMNYRFPAEQRIDRRFIQPWAQDTMTMQLTPAGDPSEPPYFGVIRLPVMDLHQLAEPYSLLGSLGPLKTPIEVYLNKSMFTGQPIDRAKEYAPRDIQWAFNDWKPAPWWAMHLPRWMYSEGHLMPGVDPETGNTILYMSATTRYQLEGYIPQIAQWDRWGLQPGQDPEKIMVHGVNKQNLLRWATGVTARTVDEEVRQQVLERQQTQVERGQERQLEQRGLLPTKPVLPRKPYIPRP